MCLFDVSYSLCARKFSPSNDNSDGCSASSGGVYDGERGEDGLGAFANL